MKTFLFLFFFFTFSATQALAQKKVAVVKLLRGEVSVLTMGKTAKLAAEDWVESGAVVKTAEKSFVKLVFIDKSQMNIGPNSEMKIENYSGKDAGVIDLVKGKIRSQVTKDYLQMDKSKSKLFIKTQNAVMGVRGTDFMISTNGKSSSVVLFEGQVVFNKLSHHGISDPGRLEYIVTAGVRMEPGEFSVMEHNKREPTVPSVLNVQQREALEKHDDSSEPLTETSARNKPEVKGSVVPAGLTGAVVANTSETLKHAVSQNVGMATVGTTSVGDPNGYQQGDKVKPANGSFLHVETGLIIPPAPDSVLDANTNTYVAGTGNGFVGQGGEYVPPPSILIDKNGNLFKVDPAQSKEADRKPASQDSSGAAPGATPIAKPSPVIPADGARTALNVPSGNFDPSRAPLPPSQALPPRPFAEPIIRPLPEQRIENRGETTNTTIRVKSN